MEISVRVDVERIPSGERLHVASAHLVYVGLDREGRPAEVAKVIAETDEERQHQAEARVRREQRLLRKRALAEASARSLTGWHDLTASAVPQGQGWRCGSPRTTLSLFAPSFAHLNCRALSVASKFAASGVTHITTPVPQAVPL